MDGNIYKCATFLSSTEGKSCPRGTKYKWEHNIKMDIKETRDGVEGVNVSQDCEQWAL